MFYDSKQMEKVTENFNRLFSNLPQVTVNKTGYEIRTHVLELAQHQLWQDYHAKWGQFETTIKRDGDTVVTTVTTPVDMPAVPTLEDIMKAAETMYDFVNQSNKRK